MMVARRLLPGLAAGLALAVGTVPSAAACPFCSAQGQTLAGEVNQADFIVLGTLTNAQRDPNDFTKGTTDLVIDTVVKPHDFLKGKKVVRIPRYVPPDPAGGATKYLVFCSLYTRPVDFTASAVTSTLVLGNYDNAVLDAYRGEPVPAGSQLAEYLKGAIEVRQKDPIARLRYFFDYLDSPDLVISADALNEFGYADYKEVRTLAEKLPADKLLKWLKDPNTPPSRFGLYGLMFGHCGKKEDAKAIRELLDSPDRQFSSGLDGMLAAYILLDQKPGWEYLTNLLKDPKQEFPVRYAGLKVLRFLWEMRPDVVPHKQVLEGVRLLVAQSDLADLPIEDLRKWGCWDQTEYVLSFADKPSHANVPIVKRAILRFALAAPPGQAKAKAFVEKSRQQDPEKVKFVEQTLRDEQPQPAAAQQATTPPAAKPGGSN
jgi:hypothetical protein